jgi:PIN domain nuclease of toxin-antitoxin system
MAESVLIDSHVLLWFNNKPDELSPRVVTLLRDPNVMVFVSSMTAHELAVKYANGKLPEATALIDDFLGILSRYGFLELPYTISDALRAAKLKGEHKDPFDRALSAQALERNYGLVSIDVLLDQFGVQRIW